MRHRNKNNKQKYKKLSKQKCHLILKRGIFMKQINLEEKKLLQESPSGDRYLPLSDYEINIFQAVKRINEEAGYSDGNFIFCDKEGRTKIREVDNCIRAQCRRAGIEVKSAHDIRRTVASEMRRKKVEIEDIQWYLGHNDEATTRTYILNNQGKQKTSRQIIEALSDMNGSDYSWVLKTSETKNRQKPD